LPIRKHRSATAISVHGQISGQNSDNIISSLFINMSFSISGLLSSLNQYQSLIVWCVCVCVCVCEVNFVLFNSMLKYVINRLRHAFFHIRTAIIPRPISTLGLKPSGRYRSPGMITVLIWKRACINL
jgi:hypothetical protein